MRVLVATIAFVLSGCGSSGRPALFPSDDLGTRVEAVSIPDGYTVRTASFGLAYSTSVSGDSSAVSGSSSERPFVNIFAVEDATGLEVLLVYELRRRSDPVLIIELERANSMATATR